tara:strand:- start:551 stop:826 length:276 start_codon:yes stop_codon:yes gene_type:complete
MKINFLEDYSNEENIEINELIYKKNYKKSKKSERKNLKYNTKLKINVDYDENEEKIVYLNFNLLLKNKNNISFDIGINKELYILIGKELFS